MFFKKEQKEKAVAQYGRNANSLLTMFMTYNQILSLRNEEQKDYFLKNFFTNISKKYGDELTNIFCKEFVPKYQGSSLKKELSKEGQRYIDADLCVHQHSHPTTFPLIQEIMSQYSESDGKKYLIILFTYRKFNKTIGKQNIDRCTIDKMQNLFMRNVMQEFGQNIFDKTANLFRKYGLNEFLYDELDEQNELGMFEWFYTKLIPFEMRKYF